MGCVVVLRNCIWIIINSWPIIRQRHQSTLVGHSLRFVFPVTNGCIQLSRGFEPHLHPGSPDPVQLELGFRSERNRLWLLLKCPEVEFIDRFQVDSWLCYKRHDLDFLQHSEQATLRWSF